MFDDENIDGDDDDLFLFVLFLFVFMWEYSLTGHVIKRKMMRRNGQ